MPGHVLECSVCHANVRVGYSDLAIDHAMTFGRTESRDEMIDDFFELNPSVLRVDPEKCPKCGAARDKMVAVHDYA